MFTRGNPDGIEFPRAPWSNECWFLVGTSLNSFDKNVCLGNFTLKTRMGKRVCVRIFIACEALNRCKSESFSVLLLWYPALSCCKFYSMTVFVVLYIYACVCLWQFGGTNPEPYVKKCCLLPYTSWVTRYVWNNSMIECNEQQCFNYGLAKWKIQFATLSYAMLEAEKDGRCLASERWRSKTNKRKIL